MHLQTHKAALLQAPHEWKTVNNPRIGKIIQKKREGNFGVLFMGRHLA